MRYFARQSENPDNEKYETPQSLHRFDVGDDFIITERYDLEDGWVDNPELIGFLGIGGDQDYLEIDEATAQHILGQLVGDEGNAAELLAGSGETQAGIDEQAQMPEPLEKGGRIHIDQEEGAWLRAQVEGGGTYPGGAKEPSDGVFAIPDSLASAQRRKGFVRGQISPAQEPELEDEEIEEAVGQVQRTFDRFISGVKNIFIKRRSDE